MNILLLLIPAALLLGLAGLGAFIWALKSGQFRDLEGAAVRILIDDDPPTDTPSPRKPPSKPRQAQDGGTGS